ncbi:MAG: c-type cytochrome [Polyangiaceae bacterium]
MTPISRTTLLLAPLLLLACSKSQDTDNLPRPAAPTPTATATAASTAAAGGGASAATGAEGQAVLIFKTRCSTCHGVDGKGNGPAAITLNPKPRNYTDPVWQKSVTDDHIREIIVKGGAALGKSPNMLANPDLADKPDVVDALVKKVRSFAPQGGAAVGDGGK